MDIVGHSGTYHGGEFSFMWTKRVMGEKGMTYHITFHIAEHASYMFISHIIF